MDIDDEQQRKANGTAISSIDKLQSLLESGNREGLHEALKELGFATVGARSRMVAVLQSDTTLARSLLQPGYQRGCDNSPDTQSRSGSDPPSLQPLQVTIRCTVADTERRLVTRLPASWLNQPLRRLVHHFAGSKLADLTRIDVDEQLRLTRHNRLLEPSMLCKDALEHEATYDVVLLCLRDDLATGSPYYLPLDDASVCEAVRRRDPRELVDLHLSPPPRFDVSDPRAYGVSTAGLEPRACRLPLTIRFLVLSRPCVISSPAVRAPRCGQSIWRSMATL